MESEIAEVYGNKVRIRACGLCWENDRLLMVKHRFGQQGFWAPPGGGVEYGEPAELAIQREFLEETGLQVIPQKFLFVCEFLKDPLHAIELFFEVLNVSGTLKNGYDPELQLIDQVAFLSLPDILKLPHEARHGIFNKLDDVSVLRRGNGFYRI